jgi:hypothetical protein
MSQSATVFRAFPPENRQFIAIFEHHSEFASALKGLEKATNAD